ncbi:hypothetical protein CGZ95_08540 [Enemella evansiae]|nr:hypothetical protein CGZ95_08540 [Enemella evansiae]
MCGGARTLSPVPDAISRSRRRAEITRAAIRAFARGGYDGTTLAGIAQAAGVSQPRISQIYGNKENAFLEAHAQAAETLTQMIQARATPPFSAERMLAGYFDVVSQDPDSMMVIFRAFTSASAVPRIGVDVRQVLGEVVDIVINGAGGTYADALDFLGRCFTIYHVLAADLPGHVQESEHFAGVLEELRRGRDETPTD